MKRWLAAVAVLAACACHVDIAAADTRSPTLWQRIVSVFAPQAGHSPSCRPAFRQSAEGRGRCKTGGGGACSRRAAAARESSGQSLRRCRRRPIRLRPRLPWKRHWSTEPFPEAAQPEVVQPQVAQPEVVTPPSVAAAKTARKHEHRDKAKAQLADRYDRGSPAVALANTQPVTALAEPSEPPATVTPGAAPAAVQADQEGKARQGRARLRARITGLARPQSRAGPGQIRNLTQRPAGSTERRSPRHRAAARSATSGRKVDYRLLLGGQPHRERPAVQSPCDDRRAPHPAVRNASQRHQSAHRQVGGGDRQ